jgi:hypothetical protein
MKRFGPVAVAAAVALGAPAHASETVLFTSGNWVVKRVIDPRVSFCGVSSVQYPSAALVSPQRLVLPVAAPLVAISVKMVPLPAAIQRMPTAAEMQARAIYIEGVELAELTRGAVVRYLVAGTSFSLDGTGFKAAADAAPSRCAGPAPAPYTPPTPEQINAINAQAQAKADQIKAVANGVSQVPTTNKPTTSPPAKVPPTSAPSTPAPPAKEGPAAPPAAAPSPGPGTPATPGTIGAGVNANNLPPEALLALAQQQQLQQKQQGIVNTLCPATVVSRMQALPLTNAQISQICR